MDRLYKLIDEFVECVNKYNKCVESYENERKNTKEKLKDFLRLWATKTKDLKCDLLFCEGNEEKTGYVFIGGCYLKYGDEKIYYKQSFSDTNFVVFDDFERSEFDVDRFLEGFEEYMQKHIEKLVKRTKEISAKQSMLRKI